MEYFLLILFTLGISYGAFVLGPLWSQILFVPALYLSYKVGFGKLGYYGDELWGARIFFVLFIAAEVLVFYTAIAELLGIG